MLGDTMRAERGGAGKEELNEELLQSCKISLQQLSVLHDMFSDGERSEVISQGGEDGSERGHTFTYTRI